MITGIYQSASGMDSLMQIQKTISNNLANVNTNGFKQELQSVIQTGAVCLGIEGGVSEEPGVPKVTENPFNLALGSTGYFTVDTGNGIAYTRNGDFSLDKEGRLITTEGYLVQGQNGPITLSQHDFVVTEAGEIVVNGNQEDQLVISHGDGSVRRLGNSLMIFEDPTTVTTVDPDKVKVMQGMLEGSNVNVMTSMTDMLLVTRLFEANQKAMESQDTALKQLISEVGKAK